MSDKTIESLIEGLTDELSPVRRFAHPFLRIAPWIIFALSYLIVSVLFLGLRPDMANKAADPFFIFETGTMLAIALSAAFASSWLCVPDVRGQKWVISVPLTLTAVFSAWIATRSITESVSMPQLHWDHCFNDGLIMGFLPGATIMFFSARGATTQPLTLAAMNILAISALGYVGLRFTCMLDTVGHSCFYHMIPFVVVGGLVGVVARRIFSW